MKDYIYKVRVDAATDEGIRTEADRQGITRSEHIRLTLKRGQEAQNQMQFIAYLNTRLDACTPVSPPKNTNADIEPLIVELLLLTRELVAERNIQILGRIANQINNLYPLRKKL